MDKAFAEELWNSKEYFAKGKRGIVYVAVAGRKKYVIKCKNPASEKDGAIQNEARFNELVNKQGIGPKFFYYDSDKDFLVREFVEGKPFMKWFAEEPSVMKGGLLKMVLVDILKQCRALDVAGINKLELTKPHKDIIISSSGKPFIIDFERCRNVSRPKNVTQFCQFLVSGKFAHELKERGVVLDADVVRGAAEDYSKQRDIQTFRRIVSLVSSAL